MKLIYLHLYKDTYLIFMQAYKCLQSVLNYMKNLRQGENEHFKIKSNY